MTHLRTSAALVLVATFLVVSASSMPVQAVDDENWRLPTTYSLPAFPEFEEARHDVMRRHDLSREEATSWVVTQEHRVRFRESAVAAAGPTYAGFRQDVGRGVQVMLLTDRSRIGVLETLAEETKAVVEFEEVEFSWSELVEVRDELHAGLNPIIGDRLQSATIDDAANSVDVHLPPSTLATAVQRAGEFHPSVRLLLHEPDTGVDEVCTGKFSCGRPLRGGIENWVERNGVRRNVSPCSVGYTATADDGSWWAISAGHCGDINDVWGHGQQFFGPVRQTWNSAAPYTEIDVGRARIDNSYWLGLRPGGYLVRVDSNNDVQDAPLEVAHAIVARGTIDVNDWVCLSALSPDWGDSCGTVTDEFTAGDGDVEVGDYDACPGDSGGAWVQRQSTGEYWAFGVHEGGEPGCPQFDGTGLNSSQGYSLFSAIPDINAFWDDLNAARLRIDTR